MWFCNLFSAHSKCTELSTKSSGVSPHIQNMSPLPFIDVILHPLNMLSTSLQTLTKPIETFLHRCKYFISQGNHNLNFKLKRHCDYYQRFGLIVVNPVEQDKQVIAKERKRNMWFCNLYSKSTELSTNSNVEVSSHFQNMSLTFIDVILQVLNMLSTSLQSELLRKEN